MRVLHVEAGRHLYGGARQVLYLLEGLAARGLESVLACPEGSDIGREAARLGVTVREIPMKGDLDFGLIGRLKRLVRQERIDLVHIHSRRGADVFGGIAAKMAGVPCVLSRRVDNPEPPWLARLKYRLFDRVITISEGIREVLLDEGVPAERVTCVRSVVDFERYQQACDRQWFRQTLGLSPEGPVLGVIAQLIPRKGHRYLLDALPAILDAHPDVQVVFFGRGPLEASLREGVAHRGLERSVLFAGFREDLERILPCLDLVVHPAEMEGLGVSLLQAQAAGVPVIGSRAGGIPEAVADERTGLLLAPGDVAGIAAAARRLLRDPAERERMGNEARRRIRSEFSIDAMVEGNLQIYRSLTGGSE